MTEPLKREGLVVLLGGGPGPADLITVAGRNWLQRAECVVYDRLAGEDLLNLAPPSAERVYVGKRPGSHARTQDEINQLLIDRCRAGQFVVRLKGGDPLVFGRGGEEADALTA